MCRQVTCKKCNKPSWAGCGAHIEQVLGHVAKSDRCSCGSGKASTSSSKSGFFSRFSKSK
ncbi:MAG: hypothetical protein EBW68_02940 [Actinobacteria bacterium]|nr:hypothetical protein [Actinomycetota bacterium]